jgi:hypothetical protein
MVSRIITKRRYNYTYTKHPGKDWSDLLLDITSNDLVTVMQCNPVVLSWRTELGILEVSGGSG